MASDKFENFTALHASYLKRVFDIMPAPGQSHSLCLIPQSNNTPEVEQYACDLVDYFIGAKSVIKYVYGPHKNDWYLGCRDQKAKEKLNVLIDLMIYNKRKKEILTRLNHCFEGAFIYGKNGHPRACFIPHNKTENLSKPQQQLATYFGWKKDEKNIFWSGNVGLAARLITDMKQQKKQTLLQMKQSLYQEKNR